MKDMIIDVEKNDSIFSILNEYLHDGINADYVRLYYHGSENVTDFGKFFEHLNIVKDLEISHLCFGNREMVDKPIMSSLKGLERLKIKECSCTSFFNKDLLCKIYKDNPKLNVFGFMNPSNVPNVNIINAAIKNQYNAKNCFVGNEPHHTSLTFSVPEKYDLNVLKNEMDKNTPYIWKAKFDRDYTSLNLKSRRNCKRCASTKIALIVFKKRYRTEYNLVH
uniref:Leucine-rich repeat domain-containing protein n=1 Tax=Parastrongyloides trichosuri TaxID=131310 RepID=A0A0N4Z7D9_PARTI